MTESFAIASVHAFPILIAAFIFKRKWAVVVAGVIMCAVAVNTGQTQYVGADLLAIAAGAAASWYFVT